MIYIIIILLIYVAFSLAATGALLADALFRPRDIFDYPNYRQELATSILIGFIPVVGWITSIFATGFCEYGWRLSRPKGQL